eukprot:3231570-Rhodomonas_salina.4
MVRPCWKRTRRGCPSSEGRGAVEGWRRCRSLQRRCRLTRGLKGPRSTSRCRVNRSCRTPDAKQTLAQQSTCSIDQQEVTLRGEQQGLSCTSSKSLQTRVA